MSEDTNHKSVHWTHLLEEYFVQTGEKCNGFHILHKQAEDYFSRKTVFIDLPTIIIGAFNGAISVGSNSLFSGSPYASYVIGLFALICSILTTINSYFSWARRAEGHRVASLQYAKLFRFISVEMSLPRIERLQPGDLLKYVKDQYDRLSEISPLLPKRIITEFKTKYGKIQEITLPDEANGLHKIKVYHAQDQLPSIVEDGGFQV